MRNHFLTASHSNLCMKFIQWCYFYYGTEVLAGYQMIRYMYYQLYRRLADACQSLSSGPEYMMNLNWNWIWCASCCNLVYYMNDMFSLNIVCEYWILYHLFLFFLLAFIWKTLLVNVISANKNDKTQKLPSVFSHETVQPLMGTFSALMRSCWVTH